MGFTGRKRLAFDCMIELTRVLAEFGLASFFFVVCNEPNSLIKHRISVPARPELWPFF